MFVLLIPISLTKHLKNPIGVNEVVNQFKERFATLGSLSEPATMEALAIEVLNKIM